VGALFTFPLDPVSDTFGYHDDGGVGIGAHHVGHDGRIHHTEPLEPTHATTSINYRHRVRGWPNLAGTSEMMGRAYVR